MAGPSGVAGAGAGVLGRDLDLSLAPAADDGPRSPSPSHVFTHPPEDLKKKQKKRTHSSWMGFLSLMTGIGTGTGMVLVLDSECVTQNQNRQV